MSSTCIRALTYESADDRGERRRAADPSLKPAIRWRYVQVDSGVLVEVEQLTLSRSIPALARWVLAPMINGAPRAALSDTLEAIVKHLGKGVPADVQ